MGWQDLMTYMNGTTITAWSADRCGLLAYSFARMVLFLHSAPSVTAFVRPYIYGLELVVSGYK